MVDKQRKPERDAAWWERMRHEYIAKNDMLFRSHPDWEWVVPYDFARTLFPEGFLEEKGCMIDWDEPGGGRPNAIAIQISHRKRKVRTRSGKDRTVPVVERYTLTDDLDGINERISDSNAKNEAVYMAPVSYFGKNRTGANARFLHAFAIDLDGVGPEQLGNVLKQVRNGYDPALPLWVSLPQPTFIVNSGTGIHLYYVLDKPVPLIPRFISFLQDFKEKLTDYVWRDTTSFLEDKQFQGIYQAYRMPGTPTKLNGKAEGSKLKDKYEAVAFAHNGPDGRPQRCSLEYLLDFAGFKRGGRDREDLLHLMETGGRTPVEQAKRLWPEWYQKRLVEGRPAGRWVDKRDLYDWWKRQIQEKATVGHRYWCLNVLAAYADKCGVPYDELEADALAFVPYLDSLTVSPDNHFTEEHALAAIAAYGDGVIHKLSRARIQRRTEIEIPANKRNYRKQSVHLEGARAVQEINDRANGTNWRNGNGRKPKRELVREYALAHPDASQRAIAQALGVSPTTVNKWLKPEPEPEPEQKAPAEEPDGRRIVSKKMEAKMLYGELAGGQVDLSAFAGLFKREPHEPDGDSRS